jgi:hypothetical protein
MVALPHCAASRRTTMNKIHIGTPKKQLRLYVPVAAAPRLEGMARGAVVKLLARLLTSAVQDRDATVEASDETD